MIAISRRRTIAVGLLLGSSLLIWWYTHQPTPDWEFNCGGEKPIVAVSADGRLLAVGATTHGLGKETPGGTRPSLTGLIQVWDIADQKLIGSCTTAEAVQSLAFTSDGSRIFAATNDMLRDRYRTMRLPDDHGSLLTWNFHGQERPIEVALPGSVQFALLSNDGKFVVAILGDQGSISGKLCVASLDALLKGRLEPVDLPTAMTTQVAGQRILFLQDNWLAVGITDDKRKNDSVDVWQIAGRKKETEYSNGRENTYDVAVSSDEKVIALSRGDEVVIVDLHTKHWADPLRDKERPIAHPYAIRCPPNGRQIAVGGAWKSVFRMQKGGIVLYHLPSWEVAGLIRLNNWGTAIRSIAFTPNGESVFTASDDGSIRMWSVKKIQTR